MNVELPSTGCNIINSAVSFYNYSNNNRTRALYYIYDGQAKKANETTSTYGYEYTGTCLRTGDLVYAPEMKIFIPFICIILIMAAWVIIYNTMLKRFLK